MKLKKKILAAVMAGGIIFGGGNALVTHAADGLLAFKEAYLAEVTDNRSFSVNADFFGPSHHAELNSKAFILRDGTLRNSGQINWEFTNPADNQVTSENIPYYVEQNGDTMTMYVQRSGRWSKFALPAIPVGIANAIKTTDLATLQQNMSAIKSVEVLKDDANQRIMNINLDGKKLAELLHTYNDENIEKLSADEKAEQKNFIDHLADALQNTDLTCAWTVNKQNWRTVTASLDLTKLVQAYGKDYLDDAAKGSIVLSQTDRKFYEALGYYSELHLVVNYSKLDEGEVTAPQGISSARNNSNVFLDLVQKISATKR